MSDKTMPIIFSGHGSPMVALDDNNITRGMARVGQDVIENYGKPKAILAISAHWNVHGTFVQAEQEPKQVYDMYGFPQELYDLKYPAKGCLELSKQVIELLGDHVSVNNKWGIDHGTWTVLVHMFPEADIPVVQLSVSKDITPGEAYNIGQKLEPLREEGYLIFASGNVVHNLMLVDWDNKDGTPMAHAFNNYIVDAVNVKDHQKVIDFRKGPNYDYAVPTDEHFLPLLYCLGAAGKDDVRVFNNICNLGSMAMTGFVWG